LPPQHERGLVGNPDLRQKAACIEPGQHGCVDDVGLDPRLGDQPDLARVGDHHPPDMRPDYLGHGTCVTSGLDHDVVVMAQRPRKRAQVIARHPHPAKPAGLAVLQDHRFCEHAVDV
jgi:hypothetical protein